MPCPNSWNIYILFTYFYLFFKIQLNLGRVGDVAQRCKVLSTMLVLLQREERVDKSKILTKPGFVTSIIYRTFYLKDFC